MGGVWRVGNTPSQFVLISSFSPPEVHVLTIPTLKQFYVELPFKLELPHLANNIEHGQAKNFRNWPTLHERSASKTA